jgi:hypothetical protein
MLLHQFEERRHAQKSRIGHGYFRAGRRVEVEVAGQPVDAWWLSGNDRQVVGVREARQLAAPLDVCAPCGERLLEARHEPVLESAVEVLGRASVDAENHRLETWE